MIGCIPYLNPCIRGFSYAGPDRAAKKFFSQAPHGSEKGEAMPQNQATVTTSFPSLAPVSLIPPIGAGVAPGFWIAVQTRSRHEKTVAAQLEQKGVQNFLPLVTQEHKWSDRNKNVSVPLF